jgi:leader peptidase (prepilin peptidase)/N-methyltransferase
MLLLTLWFLWIFTVGLCVGSFLNVVASRLPYEKSLIWPGSSCDSCLQPLRWYDNVPVFSWLFLGAKSRCCKARLSWQYPLVELGTGLAFVGLFYLEMVRNTQGLPIIRERWGMAPGMVVPEGLFLFLHHAILLSFLIAASLCDLMEMEIPFTLTMTGTVVGLIFSMLMPWPFPADVAVLNLLRPMPFPPFHGVYPWPVWYPLPEWLPAGSWQLGLVTGLAGAVAGTAVLRAVRWLFSVGRGIEGLGVGDADLMMMAGAFVGWQIVVIAFFISVGPGLIFAIARIIIKGDQMLPFGPSLAMGIMIALVCWTSLGAHFAILFFSPDFIVGLAIAGAVALLFISFLLRIL